MSEIAESIERGLKDMLDHVQGKKELRKSVVFITPTKDYTANDIKQIRDKLQMTQGFFAKVIGVSKKTVESWEYGKGKPSGAAARFLSIAEKDPDAIRHYGIASW